MKLVLTVKPNAKRSEIIDSNGSLTAFLKSAPVDGKANTELIKLLAKHFHQPQSSITIKHGSNGRKKLIEIANQ